MEETKERKKREEWRKREEKEENEKQASDFLAAASLPGSRPARVTSESVSSRLFCFVDVRSGESKYQHLPKLSFLC